jgi:hypothetical protein
MVRVSVVAVWLLELAIRLAPSCVEAPAAEVAAVLMSEARPAMGISAVVVLSGSSVGVVRRLALAPRAVRVAPASPAAVATAGSNVVVVAPGISTVVVLSTSSVVLPASLALASVVVLPTTFEAGMVLASSAAAVPAVPSSAALALANVMLPAASAVVGGPITLGVDAIPTTWPPPITTWPPESALS